MSELTDHEKLVAACEAVGIAIVEYVDRDGNVCGREEDAIVIHQLPAPVLRQRLEGWCRGKHGWMKMVASPETGQCYVWWENLDGVALGGAESKDEETARTKAVLAAVEAVGKEMG